MNNFLRNKFFQLIILIYLVSLTFYTFNTRSTIGKKALCPEGSSNPSQIRNVPTSTLPQNTSSSPRYLHPLHPQIPLSGGLRDPEPKLRLGSLDIGSDIIIGIPTIKRDSISYLEPTLSSIFDNMYSSEDNTKPDVRVVVFIGETDTTFIQQKFKEIGTKFSEQITQNKIEIITVPDDYYPKDWESSLHLQFGDPIERVKWRSKQNLDQIFLMMYINKLKPKYYLMLEDDITAKIGYSQKIMKIAESNEDKEWFYLSFCVLGAIGKLFRARTLPSYASFIHIFWNRKPLDWLQHDYVSSQVCSYDETHEKCLLKVKNMIKSFNPSLFQHVGKISSLKGKLQLLKDKSF